MTEVDKKTGHDGAPVGGVDSTTEKHLMFPQPLESPGIANDCISQECPKLADLGVASLCHVHAQDVRLKRLRSIRRA